MQMFYTQDNLSKFDPKFNVSIFFGFSSTIKAYRVYNKMTFVVEEFMHVTFESNLPL